MQTCLKNRLVLGHDMLIPRGGGYPSRLPGILGLRLERRFPACGASAALIEVLICFALYSANLATCIDFSALLIFRLTPAARRARAYPKVVHERHPVNERARYNRKLRNAHAVSPQLADLASSSAAILASRTRQGKLAPSGSKGSGTKGCGHGGPPGH